MGCRDVIGGGLEGGEKEMSSLDAGCISEDAISCAVSFGAVSWLV